MEYLIEQIAPLAGLLLVIAFVIGRLPRIELGHSDAFRRRRIWNWLPLGLTYAFLYMGRYNLKVSQSAFEELRDAAGHSLMSNADFSEIFGYGTVVYGIAFVINGPLTDRFGGKAAILVGAIGSLLANAAMAIVTMQVTADPNSPIAQQMTFVFTILYALNMYFQSFGAVAIVKVNAPWFHVRERGVFGAIFGVLISLGVFFAFDGGKFVRETFGLVWVFGVPAAILALCVCVVIFSVKNTPGDAGHEDFDTADASSGDDGPRLPVVTIFKKMLTNPIILTIAMIEFCSGFLRQAIMQWYPTFAKQTDAILHLRDGMVSNRWGVFLCAAGILGGVVAGVISDRVFQSRRGPVAAILYGALFLGAVLLYFTYDTSVVGWLVVAMSMCVIGVHGMLSGTASMDFGGKKNVGTAVGIIDGFVYLGTGLMSLTYFYLLPNNEVTPEVAADPANWNMWPGAMIPVALVGFLLATRVWNAKPKKHTPAPEPETAEAAKAA